MKSPKPKRALAADSTLNFVASNTLRSPSDLVRIAEPPGAGIFDPAVEPLLDSVDETCQRLGNISRGLIYREISSGRLKSVKIGKRRLISREAQREYIARLLSA
jgi:excisionase family DNA binding protein